MLRTKPRIGIAAAGEGPRILTSGAWCFERSDLVSLALMGEGAVYGLGLCDGEWGEDLSEVGAARARFCTACAKNGWVRIITWFAAILAVFGQLRARGHARDCTRGPGGGAGGGAHPI